VLKFSGDLVKNVFSKWIATSHRHSVLVVSVVFVAAIVAFFLGSRIEIDANLESLLPQNSPTILAMKETNQRFGSADLFTIAIVMKSPDSIAHIQDAIKTEMHAHWPDAVSVQIDRDASFFRKHALLYLPIDQLQRLSERLTRLRSDLKLGPLGVDLLSDQPAPAGPWFAANTTEQLGLPDEASEEFKQFLQPSLTDSTQTQSDPKLGVPDSLRTRLIGHMPDGRYVGIVQAVLQHPSSNMEYVKTVLERSDTMLTALRKQHGEALRIDVQGPYKELQEVNSLTRNGASSTLVSGILVLLIILLYFRAPGPVFLVLGQAGISCLLTIGFVSLTYGHLNLYTMFVLSILFGMGTDYSLYVVGYAQRLVRYGSTWPEALERTFIDMSSSLLTAWITSVAGLLTLLISRFSGFYEFGVIATVGITFSLFLTFFFLPAAVQLMHRISVKPWWAWLSLDSKLEPVSDKKDSPWLTRFSFVTAMIAIIGAVVLAPFTTKLCFEYDFSNLRESGHFFFQKAAPISEEIPIEAALGSHRTSSQPVVLLAKQADDLNELHDTLLRRLTVEHDTSLQSFLTLRSFVPLAREQNERLPFLRIIDSVVSDKIFNKASGDDSIMVSMLREMAKAKPFVATDIPAWSLDLLRERDGTYGRIGFLYDRITSADARDAEHFENNYGHLSASGRPISSYSSSFVYADLVRLVREDSLRMSVMMLLALVILLAIILHSIRGILVSAISMLLSLLWCLGLMGLFGQKVNVFNLIVITTIQGALTDVVIYIVLAWERQGRQGLREIYAGIGLLMLIAIGTTIAGWIGMIFTTHQGIQSMGGFALIGLGSCLVISLCATPWLCTRILTKSTH